MARKLSLNMYLTLDGYNEFPSYPGSMPSDDQPELVGQDMWVNRWDSIDTLLFDLKTYEEWADFWPSSKRTPDEHPWFRQLSDFAERAHKVVLTDSPKESSWTRTRFISGDIGEAVRSLKDEAGRGIDVVAPRLGMELVRRGLVDDFFFAVSPVILGKGNKFFTELEHQQTLRLVKVKSFPAGELVLHYQAVP